MVTILLELSLGSELVVECINYTFKASERVLRERIEPMIRGSFKAGNAQQRSRHEHKPYIVLELAEMQESVGGS